jgi:hypothetical protein
MWQDPLDISIVELFKIHPYIIWMFNHISLRHPRYNEIGYTNDNIIGLELSTPK